MSLAQWLSALSRPLASRRSLEVALPGLSPSLTVAGRRGLDPLQIPHPQPEAGVHQPLTNVLAGSGQGRVTRPPEAAIPTRRVRSVISLRSRRAERVGRFHAPLLHRCLPLVIAALVLLGWGSVHAQTNLTTGFGPLQISLGGHEGPQDVDTGIKVLFALTLLTLAPSILLLMTCFTRIVIVLSFVRTALQLQGTPANQIIIGLSLFITYFVMAPVWDNINHDALAPYQAQQITSAQAMDRAAHHLSVFMLRQTRPKDVELFVSMAKLQPSSTQELPLRVVIPAFIISELRTAFQMGFLIYVPFILIDLIVATVLMSMGMMMMPPTTISLPLKILLFVLVDGWDLVIHSLVRSFGL